MHPRFKQLQLKRRAVEIVKNDRRQSGSKTGIQTETGEMGEKWVAEVHHLHPKGLAEIFAEPCKSKRQTNHGCNR